MLQVNNRTPFKCWLGLFADPEGIDTAYGVVKATFEIGKEGVALSAEQVPVVMADEFWGDPGTSSLKAAAEIGLVKPATDVLLRGFACANDGPTAVLRVRLVLGPVAKTVHVFGDRIWDAGPSGLRISDPKPFERMPLRYELAFGGTDPHPRSEKEVDYEPRNPVGRGLLPKRSEAPRPGTPLPNLEDPRQPIQRPPDRPAPACFGPVCAHWEPRRRFAGTYDQAWMKKRAPILPKDFDPRFLQAAPADQIAAGYLKGDEPVELVGVHPRGPLRFRLPRCTLEVVFRLENQRFRQVPRLDTVCLEPDLRRFSLIWRAAHPVDKKFHRLQEIEFRCREFGPA